MAAVKGVIYVLESNLGFYKIGCTSQFEKRINTFSVKLPFEISILAKIPVDDMYYYESWLHNFFAKSRVNGEWFRLDYYSLKIFVEHLSTQDDLDNFINWYDTSQDEIAEMAEFRLTPASIYCFSEEAKNLHIPGTDESVMAGQAEIDRIANEIWDNSF